LAFAVRLKVEIRLELILFLCMLWLLSDGAHRGRAQVHVTCSLVISGLYTAALALSVRASDARWYLYTNQLPMFKQRRFKLDLNWIY